MKELPWMDKKENLYKPKYQEQPIDIHGFEFFAVPPHGTYKIMEELKEFGVVKLKCDDGLGQVLMNFLSEELPKIGVEVIFKHYYMYIFYNVHTIDVSDV